MPKKFFSKPNVSGLALHQWQMNDELMKLGLSPKRLALKRTFLALHYLLFLIFLRVISHVTPYWSYVVQKSTPPALLGADPTLVYDSCGQQVFNSYCFRQDIKKW